VPRNAPDSTKNLNHEACGQRRNEGDKEGKKGKAAGFLPFFSRTFLVSSFLLSFVVP
jgi:hypothetical protein